MGDGDNVFTKTIKKEVVKQQSLRETQVVDKSHEGGQTVSSSSNGSEKVSIKSDEEIVKTKTEKETSKMSAKYLEPPGFISEKKSYAEYKSDLQMWSRICSIDKKLQAEIVVYRLEGHPSIIKEKITTQLGEKLQSNENGITELISFLDSIYTEDDMAEAWDRFSQFSVFYRGKDQPMPEFIAEWENCYFKLKNLGCVYSDMILAFKLLKDANLIEMETKLVLTGVDYQKGKEAKNLLRQIKDSLKKFQGRSVILDDTEKKAVKVGDVLISEMEEIFISKGWKPPKKERRRSRSCSPQHFKNSNYKGKKNPLGDNHLPLKCYKCKCDHKENCNCPCVYHFANKCSQEKNQKGSDKFNTKNHVLGLFVDSNFSFPTSSDDDDLVFIVKESLEELVLLNTSKSDVLIDSACPTTVAGRNWLKDFLTKLDEEDKNKIKAITSEKVYKFGGGEKRKSFCKIKFPCYLATKSDLKSVTRLVQRLKRDTTKMIFPDLGNMNEWSLVGYSDAGIRSLPDKVSSCGGFVVLLTNNNLGKACVLDWRAKKLVRKVASSQAGEALALVATIGELVYIRSILKDLYGDIMNVIPVLVYIDSRNLYDSVLSTSLVDDAWLIPDIAIIKESLEQGTITRLNWIPSENMLANCLTKKGASAEKLLEVLQSGVYKYPKNSKCTV